MKVEIINCTKFGYVDEQPWYENRIGEVIEVLNKEIIAGRECYRLSSNPSYFVKAVDVEAI